MRNYYYIKEGETFGPVSLKELQELLLAGQVSSDTQVCTEGAEAWQSISDLARAESDEAVVDFPSAEPPPIPSVVHVRTIAQDPEAKPPFPKKWQYSVVPFTAVIGRSQGVEVAAAQLDMLIHNYTKDGWEYVRLESVETFVRGDSGCFGMGTTPGHTAVHSMAVFRK